jgi:hypothetical protein
MPMQLVAPRAVTIAVTKQNILKMAAEEKIRLHKELPSIKATEFLTHQLVAE